MNVLNPAANTRGSGFGLGFVSILVASVLTWTLAEMMLAGHKASNFASLLFIFAPMYGLIPALSAALAMWSWRRAKPVGPLAIASMFIASFTVPWALSMVWAPGPTYVEQMSALQSTSIGVAAIGTAMAFASTRRASVSLIAGAAAFLIVFIPGAAGRYYGETDRQILFMVNMVASALAASTAYALMESAMARRKNGRMVNP